MMIVNKENKIKINYFRKLFKYNSRKKNDQ